jgi:SAM-dependent methyltransferase
LSLIVASAFRLPFRRDSFDGLYSFLGDPFAASGFFEEAIRVLKPWGTFLYVAPAASWGRTLRRRLGVSYRATPFKSDEGQVILAPSILRGHHATERVMRLAGLRQIKIDDLSAAHIDVQNVPKHVALVAEDLGVQSRLLPVLTVASGTKPG